jgi:hypothetical protein
MVPSLFAGTRAVAAASLAVPTVTDVGAVRPAFARSERLDRHFVALANAPASEAVLRHLLVHVEASLHPQDRVALYEALGSVVRGLAPATVREAATKLFDGRYRPLLAWLGSPAEAVEAIAWAHLPGADHRLFAADAPFVQAWLAHHGCATPALALAAIRARIAGHGWAGLAHDEQVLAEQRLCLQTVEEATVLAGPALCTAFELAVVAGSEQAALSLLAACVQAGAHAGVRPALLRTWIEGDGAAWPLALQGSLQAQWLRPSALHQPAYRAALVRSLQRPALRSRCLLLDALLTSPGLAAPPERRAAWPALAALDGVYAAADAGEPIGNAAALLEGGSLAPAAVAALQRRCALEAMDQGDPHAAGVALAAARAALGDPQDAAVLQQLLLAVDEAAVRHAAAAAGLPQQGDWLGPRWQDELPLWRALAARPHEHLQPLAAYQLALLHTDGSWTPCATQKTQQLQAAQALWTELSAHPAHAARALRRLQGASLRLMVDAERRDAGRPHLWLPSPEPDARRLLIVFSCVDSHHSYTQVNALVQQMRGHHLLFINNPELNWYSDAVFDEVAQLIEARVLPRFAPGDVSCYFGSMGGHAALKFALHFGFQALVFNPQVDLALWAAFRPQQRAMLLQARLHTDVQDAPVAAFEQSPVCYFVGSSVADREAFSLWLARVRDCSHGSFIVEKRPDPHHAGLIARVAPPGGTVALLQRSLQRLHELRGMARPGMHAEVPATLLPRWWQQLDLAAALKVEILIRDGRVYVADSNATGSLPLA